MTYLQDIYQFYTMDRYIIASSETFNLIISGNIQMCENNVQINFLHMKGATCTYITSSTHLNDGHQFTYTLNTPKHVYIR